MRANCNLPCQNRADAPVTCAGRHTRLCSYKGHSHKQAWQQLLLQESGWRMAHPWGALTPAGTTRSPAWGRSAASSQRNPSPSPMTVSFADPRPGIATVIRVLSFRGRLWGRSGPRAKAARRSQHRRRGRNWHGCTACTRPNRLLLRQCGCKSRPSAIRGRG
jgi:hypothetical protein